MDRLDAMQVLLAVVDGGSLSAGSRKLNVPLPSVSRKVAELEHRLGTRLLIRTSRSVQLTDAGRDYVDAIRPIVAQLDEAERCASGEYRQPRGQLTIAVPSEFGRLIAVPLMCEFADRHPEILLHIRALDRYVDLLEERVDVGIGFGRLPDIPHYAVKVGDLAIITFASPAYLERQGRPAYPADLVDHEGILYRSSEINAWIYSVNGESVEHMPRFRVRANTASACREAAVRGLGIARLFHWYVGPDLQSGALVPLLAQYEIASWPMYVVYAKQGQLPLKVRAFVDWMVPRLRRRIREFDATCPRA